MRGSERRSVYGWWAGGRGGRYNHAISKKVNHDIIQTLR
jgi:hypothetical protein